MRGAEPTWVHATGQDWVCSLIPLTGSVSSLEEVVAW